MILFWQWVNCLVIYIIKRLQQFQETTLTKFETCSHKVIRAGAPCFSSVPTGASAALSQSQPSTEWIRPMRGQHSGHVTNQSPGHVILLTNESRGEQLPPGGQRKLPAISGRQFKHGRPAGVRQREGSVQRGFGRILWRRNPRGGGEAPCNRCYKRIKMVGSVGSPMRSQSLARLHAVRPLDLF